MKNIKSYLISIIFVIISLNIYSQDCSIISKANDILPDRLCSPVSVIWEIIYRGVNDGGESVQILIEWDDGDTDILDAINSNPDSVVREWRATFSHTYIAEDNCNYRPLATLIVNGVRCTSSEQEQIVTVWDDDNHNGGQVYIAPNIWPICVGNGDNVIFSDETIFNCVPPQEEDVPNMDTRWIQWIYGTDITMTGVPVTINGNSQVFPFYDNVITLPGPVMGSGLLSEILNVANDKLVGQYFEITLRYWNYCNPYDDPLIPGPPVDLVNGDTEPVINTAIILIVDYPNVIIEDPPPLCTSGGNIFMSAIPDGGIWSGEGIINARSGIFSPAISGTGDHTIRYDYVDGNGCDGWDSIIVSVRSPIPVIINSASPMCINDPPIQLISSIPDGTWSGIGITDINQGVFSPQVAGVGFYWIYYNTQPDAYGCVAIDSILMSVFDLPFAELNTSNISFCERPNGNQTIIELLLYNGSSFDLVWENKGIIDTISFLNSGIHQVIVDNYIGLNKYKIIKIIETSTGSFCESLLSDSVSVLVYPNPNITLIVQTDGVCSPVTSFFQAVEGYSLYYWDFGDGRDQTTNNGEMSYVYFNSDSTEINYQLKLVIESENGCIDSVTEITPVYPQPIANFFVTPLQQYYPNSIVSLNNLSNAGLWSYEWDFGDNSISHQKEPGSYTYADYGKYGIKLITYNEFCSDSIIKDIVIFPPPPVANFQPDTSGCPPLTVIFRNYSLYGEDYIWDFDDGTFSTEENPTHVFYMGKTYMVKLTVYGLSGEDDFSQSINVYEQPQALFNVYPEETKNIDQVFKFINISQYATRYLWDFGDGSTSTEESPYYIYGKEGEFDITLYVWSKDNCLDTIILNNLVTITAGDGYIMFPNVFKWNRTGPTGGWWTEGSIDNTVFRPHFNNVEKYQLLIYSRWGELVYESTELYKGWDGYIDSKLPAIQDVYVWKVWVTYVNGRSEILVGDVTFLH